MVFSIQRLLIDLGQSGIAGPSLPVANMESIRKFADLGLFRAKAPRYTSYPTANHFNTTVGPDEFASWITSVPAGSEVSLYVHIPFCRRLCWFCACRTQGTQSERPVAAYLETLKAEFDRFAETLPADIRLARMHWGGGTPTLLQPGMITELATHITDRLPLAPDAEFSVEIDPNEIDAPRLDALVEAGMNRASIGVQDFDLEIQSTIGRIQSFGHTESVVNRIRRAGVPSLNADILYGLPHQTIDKITTTVQKLLSLTPDRVALYGYAHVPWMARRQSMIPSDALPTPEERLELFETARQLFVWDGYQGIGIDHFALPADGLAIAQQKGRLRRNFQGYTNDDNDILIGLGASAISRFPQGYAQNSPATSGYTALIRNGQFATTRGHIFKGDDVLRGKVIERIMCDLSITPSDFGEDAPAVSSLVDGLDDVFGGVLVKTADGVKVPPQALPLVRMIAQFFDDYHYSPEGHSHAI